MPTPLAERLADRIEADGPLPFHAFMEAALYDPEHGYYADEAFTTGRRGDFATAPDVGPLFGATLARAVETFATEPGRLVELGPGSGRLVGDVLEHLSGDALDRLEVALVEPFEQHHDPLEARLADAGVEGRVVADAGELDPQRSMLFANEVLDALPCNVLRRGGRSWESLHVDIEDGALVERWRSADAEPVRFAEQHAGSLGTEHTYEASIHTPELVGDVAEILDPGVALLTDYGGRFEEVWPQRRDGTLRAFRDHQQVDPLSRPGETDITYDVDFSMVQRVAKAAGLETTAYGPQEKLLVHLGLVEVAQAEDALEDVKTLLVPGGFGGRFQALVLDKGDVASELDLRLDLEKADVWDRGLEDLGVGGG